MKRRFVWMTDRLAPASEAALPIADFGFLYGDTLFETLRVVGGRPVAWGGHVRRFYASAVRLHHRIPLSPVELRDALHRTLAANDLADAAVRITLTRGRNPSGFDIRSCVDPALIITVRPYAGPDDALVRRGMHLRTVRVPDRTGWLRYRAKTGNYLDMLLALDEATHDDADEALLVDRTGRVLEGARANFFVVIENRLLTPPASLGVLPGITRARVLDWARRMGIPHRVTTITVRGVRGATEVFLTNSLWGIMPVSAINRHPVGDRFPGPVTSRLLERWRRYLERVR